MALFRVVAGDNTGKIYPIQADKLTIGRDSEEIPVLDQGVSRQHAEIFRIGELYFIRDLGSRNGTFVNHHQIAEQEVLRAGDRVHVGNTEMVFEDRFARDGDSRIVRFGDSVERPDNTISFRLDKAAATVAGDATAEAPNRTLEILYNVTRHLGTDDGLEVALNNIACELCGALNADHVYLFAFDHSDEDEFRTVASYDRDPVEELHISRSILRRVRDEKRPILSSDATLDDRFTTSESIVMKKIKSLLCVPLLAANKTVGAFYATNSKLSEVFSPEDLTLATTIGMMVGNAVEMQWLLARQGALYRDALKTLADSAAARTPDKRGRAERVASHAAAIGRGLGLPNERVRRLWVAGLLCDIGTVALSDLELENSLNLAQRITKKSADLLEDISELREVVPAVRHHLEYHDGSGFPEGLKDNQIPLDAQCVGMARAFEDMLQPTSGEREMSTKEAIVHALELTDKKFSAKVVNGLLIAYRRNHLFQEEESLFRFGD